MQRTEEIYMNYKEFEIIPAFSEKEKIAELFGEYTQYLVDNDPVFAEYLAIQKYDDELNDLEHKYGMPDGRLYIALDGDKAAGCVGLRKIDDDACELKRMYVRPEYRGRGLARFFGEMIMREGAEIGYKYMLLDTLPFLKAAQSLYKKLGFYEINRYNNSPMEDAIYMRYDFV